MWGAVVVLDACHDAAPAQVWRLSVLGITSCLVVAS
jgi:hypothetical protein